jgi:hypothetical protein
MHAPHHTHACDDTEAAGLIRAGPASARSSLGLSWYIKWQRFFPAREDTRTHHSQAARHLCASLMPAA